MASIFPLHTLIPRLWQKARYLRKKRLLDGIPMVTLRMELAKASLSFEKWYSREVQGKILFYSQVQQDSLNQMRTKYPEEVRRTVEAAEQILRHRFSFLGARDFCPVDSVREIKTDGYVPINWFYDPISNLEFPRDIPHKDWNLYKMRPGMADIKLPWELGRCQHWICFHVKPGLV